MRKMFNAIQKTYENHELRNDKMEIAFGEKKCGNISSNNRSASAMVLLREFLDREAIKEFSLSNPRVSFVYSWMPIQIGLAKSFTGTLYTIIKWYISVPFPVLRLHMPGNSQTKCGYVWNLCVADTKAFSGITPFSLTPASKNKIQITIYKYYKWWYIYYCSYSPRIRLIIFECS